MSIRLSTEFAGIFSGSVAKTISVPVLLTFRRAGNIPLIC